MVSQGGKGKKSQNTKREKKTNPPQPVLLISAALAENKGQAQRKKGVPSLLFPFQRKKEPKLHRRGEKPLSTTMCIKRREKTPEGRNSMGLKSGEK